MQMRLSPKNGLRLLFPIRHRGWAGVRLATWLMFVALLSAGSFAAPEDHDIVPLYPGHNDVHRKRLNLIFIGAEYPDFRVFEKIALDLISLRGEHPDGLMQVVPFKDLDMARRFNFWIDKNLNSTGLPYQKIDNQAIWECLSSSLNEVMVEFDKTYDTDLNRGSRGICAVLLANVDPRELPKYGYGGGSFGRGATFTVWHKDHPWFSYDDMVVTHVHELMHSIPEIHDDYGSDRDIYDDPNWGKIETHGQFFIPGGREDPGRISREAFLAMTPDFQYDYVRRHCPWKDHLGDGFGVPKVIDAYDARKYRMTRELDPKEPDDPRANLEVGVFEGGLGCGRHIYRSVRNSLMCYPYGLKIGRDGAFGPYLESLIRDRICAEFDDSPLP